MRYFRNIVESDTAPTTDNIWINGTEIKYFKEGSWVSLGNVPSKNKEEKPIVIPDLYQEYKKAGGTKSRKNFIKVLVEFIG